MLVAVLMLMSSFAALAADEKSIFNGQVDGSISISGLMAGDKVSFYKVLGFDKDNVTYKGWAAEDGFTSLTDAQMKAIVRRP